MSDAIIDSRFELINKAKELLIENTNISDSPDEMAVIDNILFRCWQMGWLNVLDDLKPCPLCGRSVCWVNGSIVCSCGLRFKMRVSKEETERRWNSWVRVGNR